MYDQALLAQYIILGAGALAAVAVIVLIWIGRRATRYRWHVIEREEKLVQHILIMISPDHELDDEYLRRKIEEANYGGPLKDL